MSRDGRNGRGGEDGRNGEQGRESGRQGRESGRESGRNGKECVREDGRAREDARPLFIQRNFMESGSKIISKVAINQSLESKLIVDFKYAPFSTAKRRGYMSDAKQQEMCLAIEQALRPAIRFEKHLNTCITISLQCLESNGQCASLANAITCASLALIEANIEMIDIVIGASCCFLHGIMIDATQDEEQKSSGTMVLSLMPNLNSISQLVQLGYDQNLMAEAIEICMDSCHSVHKLVQDHLLN